jgi:hypothetical protein
MAMVRFLLSGWTGWVQGACHFFSVKLQDFAFSVNERRCFQFLENFGNLTTPHKVAFPIPRIVKYFYPLLSFPETLKAEFAHTSYELRSNWFSIFISAIQLVYFFFRIFMAFSKIFSGDKAPCGLNVE